MRNKSVNKRRELARRAEEAHRLQRDFAGTGSDRVEKSLAAEENVFNAFDHLDIERTRRIHPRDRARVADYLLARYEQLTRPESASADSVQA